MKTNSIINYQELWDRIKEYAMKVGRVAVRPVLLLYYVMRSDETPWKDRLTIFGASSTIKTTEPRVKEVICRYQ